MVVMCTPCFYLANAEQAGLPFIPLGVMAWIQTHGIRVETEAITVHPTGGTNRIGVEILLLKSTK